MKAKVTVELNPRDVSALRKEKSLYSDGIAFRVDGEAKEPYASIARLEDGTAICLPESRLGNNFSFAFSYGNTDFEVRCSKK